MLQLVRELDHRDPLRLLVLALHLPQLTPALIALLLLRAELVPMFHHRQTLLRAWSMPPLSFPLRGYLLLLRLLGLDPKHPLSGQLQFSNQFELPLSGVGDPAQSRVLQR